MTAPTLRWRRAAVLCALATLALAGCSMGRGADTGSAPAVDEAVAPAPAYKEPGAEGPTGEVDGRGEGGVAQGVVKLEEQQRSIIYTARMSVRVARVAAAADRAVDLAVAAGGVVGEDRRILDGDKSQATLVLRVPSDSFMTTLDRLAELGTALTREVQTRDVTEDLIDLDARIATQQASVDRVRALMSRANTIGEIVSLESELARREAELDSLKQRRERLAGLVAFSTITLELHGPTAPAPQDEPETGFMAGLRHGWAAFLASVTLMLTVAGWLLPWALALGVPLLVLMWLLRRRDRAKFAPAPALPAQVSAAARECEPEKSPSA